jgi:hypothetical protein
MYDKQVVRDAVFELIVADDLTALTAIMEKSKAQPQTPMSEDVHNRQWVT